jgi:hypothetical protein
MPAKLYPKNAPLNLAQFVRLEDGRTGWISKAEFVGKILIYHVRLSTAGQVEVPDGKLVRA